LLRRAGLLALVIGGVGSVALMLRASEHPPVFLILLFIVWVSSPFVALAVGHVLSAKWPAATRTALYAMMIVAAIVSLTAYANAGPGVGHPRTKVFLFVLVPPVVWVIAAIAIGAAAMTSRRG
jgi:hypothetical protein